MTYKISELLDDYPAEPMEMAINTPLSGKRIREMTMRKVNKNKPKRILFRVLVAAAIIAALAMTAFAAEKLFGAGDVIRDTFHENLSDDQVEVINDLGASFVPQTISSEGTTMTLAAAYGDENVLFLYLQVVAPEGTVLPDGIEYDFYDYNTENWNVLELPEDIKYGAYGYSISIQPLADADPTDNRKDFYVTMHGQTGAGIRFNDGVSKLYHITGIYEQVADADGDRDAYAPILTGDFTFDVGLCNKAEMVDLNVDGLTYGGAKTRAWTHDSPCGAFCDEFLTGERDAETGLPIHSESWEISVTARRLALSSLSADWEVTYEATDGHTCGLEFFVVMKDGTIVEMKATGGRDDGHTSSGTVIFAEPINFAEVDYILIGDPDVGEPYKMYLTEE